MQKLIEAMLAVCARFSEVYNSCIVVDNLALQIDSFTVAFHVKLLNMRNELAEGLGIG
jgi:hypothetical protein